MENKVETLNLVSGGLHYTTQLLIISLQQNTFLSCHVILALSLNTDEINDFFFLSLYHCLDNTHFKH